MKRLNWTPPEDMFSCRFLEVFQNSLYAEHLRLTGSE